MASIKIYGQDMSCFFANGIGDSRNQVPIGNMVNEDQDEFLGHFTVRQRGSVYLSGDDCSNDPMYEFPIGRYFVYLCKPRHFVIALKDQDLHA
jgi:hypothetical protein